MLPLGISLSHHFMGPTLAGRIMKSTQSHQISSIMRKHEGTWKRGGQLGLEMCVCKGWGASLINFYYFAILPVAYLVNKQ